MFRVADCHPTETVSIRVENKAIEVPAGISVATAMLLANVGFTRTTPIAGSPRAPYCMMGMCFECLVTIDELHNVQGCTTPVRDGMSIRRQTGARKLRP